MISLRGRIDKLEAAAGEDDREVIVVEPCIPEWKGAVYAGYCAPFPVVPKPEDKAVVWLMTVGRMFADDPLTGLTRHQADFLARKPDAAVVVARHPIDPPEEWEETTPARALARIEGVPRVTGYRLDGQPAGYE